MSFHRVIGLLLCSVVAAGYAPRVGAQVPVAAKPETVRASVTAILKEQQAAWNRGDIPAFMEGYWKSPDVTFSGTGGVTRGWETVLERYQKHYPDAAAMGKLDFTELEVRLLGSDAALVLGKWHLTRSGGDVGGVFTLVFQKFPEGWRIIHDHTSSVETGKK